MPTVSKGSVYRPTGTKYWWIRFSLNGKNVRESARAEDREVALALLASRIDEARRGMFTSRNRRVTFEDLCAFLVEDYRFKQNRTEPGRFVKQLAVSFAGMYAEEITEERIKEHSRIRVRRDAVKPATLRRELAVLNRMFHLAGSRIPRIPRVEFPRVENARRGFFEEHELRALLPHLPPHARYLVEFLYFTGWRVGEALGLQWRDIDWQEQIVRLRTSKNREPRIFPFSGHPQVDRVIRAQREDVTQWEREHGALCATVFHWHGRRIGKIRRAWLRACRLAGLQGRLLHDFRRTAVRNLVRAGVRQHVAMKITGHKTEMGFSRYLIVDLPMLEEATARAASYLEDYSPGTGTTQPGTNEDADPPR